MQENLSWRGGKHPWLEYHPSAGSIFKKIEGVGAGRLIDQVGLKGFRHGDAQISHIHANIMVNLGKATAQGCPRADHDRADQGAGEVRPASRARDRVYRRVLARSARRQLLRSLGRGRPPLDGGVELCACSVVELLARRRAIFRFPRESCRAPDLRAAWSARQPAARARHFLLAVFHFAAQLTKRCARCRPLSLPAFWSFFAP